MPRTGESWLLLLGNSVAGEIISRIPVLKHLSSVSLSVAKNGLNEAYLLFSLPTLRTLKLLDVYEDQRIRLPSTQVGFSSIEHLQCDAADDLHASYNYLSQLILYCRALKSIRSRTTGYSISFNYAKFLEALRLHKDSLEELAIINDTNGDGRNHDDRGILGSFRGFHKLERFEVDCDLLSFCFDAGDDEPAVPLRYNLVGLFPPTLRSLGLHMNEVERDTLTLKWTLELIAHSRNLRTEVPLLSSIALALQPDFGFRICQKL